MRWVKKIVCVFLSICVIASPVFADIPDKTVIIGDEAFNLNYANDKGNIKKIRAALDKNTGEIIIKARNTWFSNDGDIYKNVNSLPGIVYTDANGKVHEYREQNGEKIQGKVLVVGVQDKNNLRIILNQKPDKEWISNKENFMIGNKSLTKEDKVTYNKEYGFVEIKLHEEMEFIDPIKVSLKNVTNQYGEVLYEEFEESIFVLDSKDKQGQLKDFKGSVSIIGKDMDVSLEDIKGAVYLSGSKVTVNNYNSDKDIVISESMERLTLHKVKCLNILSFARGDIKLNQSEIKELVTGNINLGKIIVENSKIGEMRIFGDTTVESIDTFISNLKILSETNIKLKGEFNEVNVIKNATIELLKNSNIKTSLNVYSGVVLKTVHNSHVNELNLNGKGSKSIISGNIKTLNIKAPGEVNLNNANIETVELLSEGTTINSNDKTIIEGFNQNNFKYQGKIVIKKDIVPNSGGSSNGGSSYGGSSNGGSSNGGSSNDTIDVNSIVLKQTHLTMELLSEYQLSAEVLPSNATNKTLTWSSSDTSIVTVDQNGKVVAMKAGHAVISATTNNGKSAKCNVTVVPIPVDSIVLEEERTMELGERLQLVAKVYPNNATNKNLIWNSSNPEIISVDENGILMARKLGTVIITVVSNNSKVATCIVKSIPRSNALFVNIINNKAVIELFDTTESENIAILQIMNKRNGNLELIQEYELTSGNMEIELELNPGVYTGEINIVNSRRFKIKTFNID